MEVRKIIIQSYDKIKIQWLITSIATASLIYITSSEIWNIFNIERAPNMSPLGLFIYTLGFSILIIYVNYEIILINYEVNFYSNVISSFTIFLIDVFVVA